VNNSDSADARRRSYGEGCPEGRISAQNRRQQNRPICYGLRWQKIRRIEQQNRVAEGRTKQTVVTETSIFITFDGMQAKMQECDCHQGKGNNAC
jgi:hypothetical protein